MKLTRFAKATSVFAAAALALSACSSAPATEETTEPAAGDGPHIAVVGGAAFDGFWNIVKNGVESAANAVEAAGGKVTWLALQTYDNLGPDAGDLVRDAIGLDVDAIAVPDWVPEAEEPAIKDAIAAGIPVFIYNAGGIEAVERTGALKYVGTDEYKAGFAAGVKFGEDGAKNVICVNTTPGSVNQETRCSGVADGIKTKGGASKQLPLPSSSFGDPASIAQAVKGALVEDSSIDGVITIGAQDSDAAFSGIEQANKVGTVKHGTFDLSENVLNRIKDGTQLFAVDQQPFLQGYTVVSFAWQYVHYGISSADTAFLTGPSLVTSANIDATLFGVSKGTR